MFAKLVSRLFGVETIFSNAIKAICDCKVGSWDHEMVVLHTHELRNFQAKAWRWQVLPTCFMAQILQLQCQTTISLGPLATNCIAPQWHWPLCDTVSREAILVVGGKPSAKCSFTLLVTTARKSRLIQP